MLNNFRKKDTIESLHIKTIKNDCIVCDTHLNAIIDVSGVSLYEKDEAEARGAITGLFNIINEIDVPVQLITQSRPKSYKSHINQVKKELKKNDFNLKFKKDLEWFQLYYQDDLSKGYITPEQIKKKFDEAPEYIERSMLESYIERLDAMTKRNNILEKRYYLVISTLDKPKTNKEKDEVITNYIYNYDDPNTFAKSEAKLNERVKDMITLLLKKSGMYARRMQNDELLDIMFDYFNFPGSSNHQMNNNITHYGDMPPILKGSSLKNNFNNTEDNLILKYSEIGMNGITSSLFGEDKDEVVKSNKVLQLIKPFSLDNSNINYLKINSSYTFTVHINRFGDEYLEDLMLWPILTLPFFYDLSVYLVPINKEEMLIDIKQEYGRLKLHYEEKIHNAKSEKERAKFNDDLKIDAGKLSIIEDDLRNKETGIFLPSIDITFRAKNLQELNKIKEKLDILGAKKIFFSEVTGDHLKGFISTAPIMKNKITGYKNFFKWFPESLQQVRHYFPYCPSNIDSPFGVALGISSQGEGEEKVSDILFFNLFEKRKVHNPIMLTVGQSGSGKTVTEQGTMKGEELLGIRHLVIDFLGNYFKWALDMPDRFKVVKISPDSNDIINPCDIVIPNNEYLSHSEVYGGRSDEDIKESIINKKTAALGTYFKIFLGNEYTSKASALLDAATKKVYMRKMEKINIREEKYINDILLKDIILEIEKEKDPDKKSLAKEITSILSRYTSGSYGNMFNKPTNIDFGDKSIVFYLGGNDDIQSETLATLQSFIIIDKIVSSSSNNLIVIDELSKLFRLNDKGIESDFRGKIATVRNRGAGVHGLTQFIDQIVNTEAGIEFIKLAETKMILAGGVTYNQKDSFNVIDYFQLSNGSRDYLLSHANEKGHGILLYGRDQVQFKIDNHADLALYKRYAALRKQS